MKILVLEAKADVTITCFIQQTVIQSVKMVESVWDLENADALQDLEEYIVTKV